MVMEAKPTGRVVLMPAEWQSRLAGAAYDSHTPTSLLGHPLSCGCRSERLGPGTSGRRTPRAFGANDHRFVYGQEPHTKSNRNFPLELRAKTDFTPLWLLFVASLFATFQRLLLSSVSCAS